MKHYIILIWQKLYIFKFKGFQNMVVRQTVPEKAGFGMTEWAVRMQKWTLTAMSLYTLTDLWVSPRSGWFSSTCRSSSWSIPAYFSRRRNGLLRPVVRTRRPGLAAPWDSINSFSSVLQRPQTNSRTEKCRNSVANKLTSIHSQDYTGRFHYGER